MTFCLVLLTNHSAFKKYEKQLEKAKAKAAKAAKQAKTGGGKAKVKEDQLSPNVEFF